MLALQIPESTALNYYGDNGGSGWAFRNGSLVGEELTRYGLSIHGMQFYSQTIEGTEASSVADYVLDLQEWKIEKQTILTATSNENIYFNVSPTADAILFGLQATEATAGPCARMSCSELKAFFKDHLEQMKLPSMTQD